MSEHSTKFSLVKEYFEKGEWKKKAVENAVKRGWITPEEFCEITGEEYE